MARFNLGGAEFLLEVGNAPLVRGLAEAETKTRASAQKMAAYLAAGNKEMERSIVQLSNKIAGEQKKAASAAAREAARIARANQQASQSFHGSAQSMLAFGAAAAGVTLGAAGVHQALSKLVDASQKAAQAQFALNKTYGASAAEFSAFAQAQGEATARSNRELEQGAVIMGTLQKNYGFTNEQIKTLIKISLDMAAVTGVDAVEAFKSVQAAMRGEGEAAEKLGFTLNREAVRAMANLTDEQRKNFETLSDVERAQLIYNEALRQAAPYQGAAEERAKTSLGTFDRLGVSLTKLAESLGKSATPQLVGLASTLELVAKRTTDVVEAWDRANRSGFTDPFATGLSSAAAHPPASVAGFAELESPAFAAARQADQASRAQEIAAREERRRQAKKELEEQRKAREDQADLEIDLLNKEIEATRRAAAEKRKQYEADRDAAIRAAEEKRDAAIRALDEEAAATARAFERRITAAELERDARKKALEDAKDAALETLEAEAEAARENHDARIRQAEIERDRAKEAAEARRDAAIEALDAEKRARDNARIQEDRAQEDAQKAALRRLEERHEAAVRALEAEAKAADRARDRKIRALEAEADKARSTHQARIRQIEEQADAARAAHDAAIRAIEEQADAENERHRQALDNLEQEEDARLGAIDAELRALDRQARAEDRAEEDRRNQERLDEAKRKLAELQAQGSQAAIDQARRDLEYAQRAALQDPAVIQRAKERLAAAQAALPDPKAIREAQKEIADIEREIQRTRLDREREAQREQLEAKKAAIRQEIEARRQQEEEQTRQREQQLENEKQAAKDALDAALKAIEAEKAAADDALAKRLQSLDKRKQAVNDATQKELDAIARRKQVEQDAHDEAVRLARDQFEAQKRVIEDRRRAEDQADQDKRRQIQATYQAEQDAIRATYDDEATGLIPAIRRSREETEKAYDRRREAIRRSYAAEQEALDTLYNHPLNGVIAKLREQARVAAEEYQRRKERVEEAYKNERQQIEDTYNHPQTGLFARLEQSTQKTIDEHRRQIEAWQQWKTDTKKEIQEALDKLDEFIKRVGDLDKIGVVLPRPPGGTVENPPGQPVGGGGGQAFPVVRNAKPHSYVTDKGTHEGGPAADIFADKGAPIYAPEDGRLEPFTVGRGGNAAILRGASGLSHYFAHGNVPFRGGQVKAGEPIGEVGNTGAEGTEPHLHYARSSDPNDGFTRGKYGGSGNVWFGPEVWTTGGTLTGATTPEGAIRMSGDELVINLFGRRITIRRKDLGGPTPAGFRAMLERIRATIEKYGIPPEVPAAIAGNESGYGERASELARKYHNWFGVKGEGTAGQTPPLLTHEYINGRRVDVYERFAAYKSDQDAFEAWGRRFSRGRWAAAKAAYQRGGRPIDYLQGLFEAGYATDPDWVNKVRRIGGFRYGGMIAEPTLLVGLRSGPYALAGEAGPERVLSPEATRAGGTVIDYDRLAEAMGRRGSTFTFNGYASEEVVRVVRMELQRERVHTRLRRAG